MSDLLLLQRACAGAEQDTQHSKGGVARAECVARACMRVPSLDPADMILRSSADMRTDTTKLPCAIRFLNGAACERAKRTPTLFVIDTP